MRPSAALRLVGVLLLLGCAQDGARKPEPAPEPPAARAPARLLLVSISGLGPERYREAGAMPTLASLAAAGVSADAVRGVAPTASHPAHATLVTGRRPARHGIVADRALGDHGVRRGGYEEASQIEGPTLWGLVGGAGARVAALEWPSTRGADIDFDLPAVGAGGRSWLETLKGVAKPPVLEAVAAAGGDAPETAEPGAARDAVLAQIACQRLTGPEPPSLVLLRFSETEQALAAYGPAAPETREAFRATDALLGRLLGCLRKAGRLDDTAVAVVGDHDALSIHTFVAPNVVLGKAGLLTVRPVSGELISWAALARSNGGSAFVYARRRDDAVLARRALEDAARETGSFRVVGADEMLSEGADPAAWFGLEAAPGYLFSNTAAGPLQGASGVRGGWGYLPSRAEMNAGFVAWGPGLGRGLRIPEMDQTDVAPTLARLLGLTLEGAEGHVLVGVLRTPPVAAPARH